MARLVQASVWVKTVHVAGPPAQFSTLLQHSTVQTRACNQLAGMVVWRLVRAECMRECNCVLQPDEYGGMSFSMGT